MILQSYILPDGNVCGIDSQTWSEVDLYGNAPFLTGQSLVAGYSDITGIVNWHKYGGNAYYDYMQVYKQIATLVYTKILMDWANWDNLSQGEKDVALIYCIPPYALRVSHVPESQDAENWKHLIVTTRAIRNKIVELMREVIADDLRKEIISKQDSDQFYIDTADLLNRYEFTNNNGFKQWLTNEAGSPYENDGFAQKTYYTVARKDALADVVINLNY